MLCPALPVVLGAVEEACRSLVEGCFERSAPCQDEPDFIFEEKGAFLKNVAQGNVCGEPEVFPWDIVGDMIGGNASFGLNARVVVSGATPDAHERLTR